MAEAPVLPTWKYHVSGASRIVTTVEELQALAPGEWFESPQEAADAAARTQEADGGDEPRPRSRR